MNLGFTQIDCVHKFPSNLRWKLNDFSAFFAILIPQCGHSEGGGSPRDLLRRLYFAKEELIFLP